MALPYTLDLAGSGTGSAFVQGLGEFGTGSWSGTLPAARSADAVEYAIRLDIRGSGQSTSGFGLYVGPGASGGQELDDELETARLKIQNADGTRTYWQGVLRDTDASEPYVWNPGDGVISPALAGQGSGQSTVRLRFEQSREAIDADIGTVSSAAPSARVSAEVASATAVAAEGGAVSGAAPSATLSATPAADPVDARPGTVSGAAPSAALTLSAVSATPRDAQPGTVATGAPTARLVASRRTATVNADPGTVSSAAPTAEASAEATPLAVDARPGALSTSAPRATLSVVAADRSVDARPGTVSAAAPAARFTLAAAGYDEDYAVAVRAAAPARRVLTCVELRHPAALSPVRLVNDTESRVVDGETYVRSRFEAKFVDDPERRAPRAQVVVGNVGRDIQQWIELIGGGAGGTARFFEVIDIDGASPEWEMTLDMVSVGTDSAHVSLSVGFDPLLGRPAVALRFDPQTAPGLF